MRKEDRFNHVYKALAAALANHKLFLSHWLLMCCTTGVELTVNSAEHSRVSEAESRVNKHKLKHLYKIQLLDLFIYLSEEQPKVSI